MWTHFLKNHSLRFAIVAGSIVALYYMVTSYVLPDEGTFMDQDALKYYCGIFTFVVLAGTFIKGFNNKILVFMGIVTTFVEIGVTNLLIMGDYNVYRIILVYAVPSAVTLAVYQYYPYLMLKAGELGMKYAKVFPEKASKRIYAVGSYLMMNVEKTNLHRNITLVLKLHFCAYVGIVTYIYCFLFTYGYPAEGLILPQEYTFERVWYIMGLPNPLLLLDELFVAQTYITLGLIFRAAIQEHYVKDLTGELPFELQEQFAGK